MDIDLTQDVLGVPIYALIVIGLVVLVLVVALLGGRRKRPADVEPDLTIDVASLPLHGPPTAGAQLEFYNLPVRLAALVLAPVGRGHRLPPKDELAGVVDEMLPGLMQVMNSHQPQFRRWPPQLSSQGFAVSFFRNAALPGDHGRGTPWCSVAGKAEEREPHVDGRKWEGLFAR